MNWKCCSLPEFLVVDWIQLYIYIYIYIYILHFYPVILKQKFVLIKIWQQNMFKYVALVQSPSLNWLFKTPWTAARFPCPHHLPEFAQVHVHWISDAIQSSHLLSPSSPPAFNLSLHQGLFQWVSCSHKVARVLEPQLLHLSFQWVFRADFL